MNTRQLYRYIFTAFTQEEAVTIRELLGRHKKAWKFRGILRTLHAERFEQALYGNSTDTLEAYETPYEVDWDWAERFERINDQYQLLESSQKTIEKFKQIFYVKNF